MADYGFLGALGAGLKGGLEGYMAAQKMENEKRRLDILEKNAANQTAWKEAQGLLARLQAENLEDAQTFKKVQLATELEKGGGKIQWRPVWIDPKTGKKTFTKPESMITDEDTESGDEDMPDSGSVGYEPNFMTYEPPVSTAKLNLDALGSASPELISRAQQLGVLPTEMLPSRAKSFSHNQIMGMIKEMRVQQQKAPAPIDERKQFDLEQAKLLADEKSDISKALYQEALAFSKKYGTPEPVPNRTGNEYKMYLDRFKGGYAKPPAPVKPQGLIKSSLSPGQKSSDAEFGKEYSRFVSAGGFAKMKESMRSLNEAIKEVDAHPEYFGGISRWIGGKAEKAFNPGLVSLRQKVQKIIQQDLRPTLGAQFTEKEGQGLMERTFDAQLDGPTTAKKLKEELRSLQGIVSEKERAMRHWERNKTMSGYGVSVGGEMEGGLIPKQKSGGGDRISPKDAKALEWLNKNPKHPSAEGVRKKLKAKGLL